MLNVRWWQEEIKENKVGKESKRIKILEGWPEMGLKGGEMTFSL